MSWVDVTTAVGTAGAASVALSLGVRAEWRATRTERQQRGLDVRRQAAQIAARTGSVSFAHAEFNATMTDFGGAAFLGAAVSFEDAQFRGR
jgi:hypothetical protein